MTYPCEKTSAVWEDTRKQCECDVASGFFLNRADVTGKTYTRVHLHAQWSS